MMKVKKIIAYTLSVLVLLFSVVAILGIWEIVDIEDLIARMFKSLMVILAAAAVVVLIFSILDRPERKDEPES
jgi:heme A synthase